MSPGSGFISVEYFVRENAGRWALSADVKKGLSVQRCLPSPLLYPPPLTCSRCWRCKDIYFDSGEMERSDQEKDENLEGD